MTDHLLARESDRPVAVDAVADRLLAHLAERLDVTLHEGNGVPTA